MRVSSLTISVACQARYCLQGLGLPQLPSPVSKDLGPRGSIREGVGGKRPQGLLPRAPAPWPLPSSLLALLPSLPRSPFLSDFLTVLCLQGGYSSPCSLLPCLTAFLLFLPSAAWSVPPLPLSPNGCRVSSLQRSSGRAEGRHKRGSPEQRPEASGGREHLGGEDLPPFLLAWLPLSLLLGTRLQYDTAGAPQPWPACHEPQLCNLTSHATSFALPPLSFLAGLPFSPSPPSELPEVPLSLVYQLARAQAPSDHLPEPLEALGGDIWDPTPSQASRAPCFVLLPCTPFSSGQASSEAVPFHPSASPPPFLLFSAPSDFRPPLPLTPPPPLPSQ